MKCFKSKIVLVVVSFILFSAGVSAEAIEEEVYTLQKLKSEGWSISKPITVDKVEQDSFLEIQKAKKQVHELPLVPFGYQQERWEGFKALLKENEKIYLISAPDRDWENIRGTKGYAIIRNEKVVYYFRTMVN